MTDLHALLRDAYLLGFMSSGEGYNGEYPFSGLKRHPPNYAHWTELRDTELAPLLARIDAALAEPQWRPIETAPKDGRVVLKFVPPQNDGDEYSIGIVFDGTAATHWMPLPAPPLPEKP